MAGAPTDPAPPAAAGSPLGPDDAPQEGRHQDAGLLTDDAFALLLGVRVELFSSWLQWARYDAEAQVLTLWTHDGRDYAFPGVSFDEARDFAAAPSKGGWYWDHLHGR